MSRNRRNKRAAAAVEREPRRPSFEPVLLVCLALTAVTLAVYARVWTHDFVGLDDHDYIMGNAPVLKGLTADGVVWAFTTGHSANWHPLTWLSHMLDVQLYGLNAGPHHLTSLALHVANTLLLFGVLQRMTGKIGRSAVVAALFALHPLHVESVAWAAERKDVLSALFWMLTLWAYVAYVRRPGLARYGLTLGTFALGLMAKPMLVTLPFVLLLLDFWPLGRLARSGAGSAPQTSSVDRRIVFRLLAEKVPFVALTVVSSVVTVIVQWGAVREHQGFPLAARVGNALTAYVAYLGTTFWPVGLAMLYPLRFVSLWAALASLAALIGISLVVVWAARRSPAVLVGWLWYLGTLVPVIGLVQVGAQSRADRYTYIPLIGVFVMLAWGIPELLARWPARRVVLPALTGAALAICAGLAYTQLAHWKNNGTLWARTAAMTTDNFGAHFYLGNDLRRAGRPRDAIVQYREALRILPRSPMAHNNLAFTLAELGNYDEAIAHYTEAIGLMPGYAEARNNLALALAAQGKVDAAVREAREAVRLAPERADLRFNLAAFLARDKQLDEAVREYGEGLRRKPGHADSYYRLGLVLIEQGRRDAAAYYLERALRLEPQMQRARRALDELKQGSSPASARQ
jgi:tetratricopeptide (TPR) repeat protein